MRVVSGTTQLYCCTTRPTVKIPNNIDSVGTNNKHLYAYMYRCSSCDVLEPRTGFQPRDCCRYLTQKPVPSSIDADRQSASSPSRLTDHADSKPHLRYTYLFPISCSSFIPNYAELLLKDAARSYLLPHPSPTYAYLRQPNQDCRHVASGAVEPDYIIYKGAQTKRSGSSREPSGVFY